MGTVPEVSERVAAIDVGTNSVLLLVAERRGSSFAADGFDQQDARLHAPREQIDGGPFIRERRALCGDDLKVVGQPAFITRGRKIEGMLRRVHRLDGRLPSKTLCGASHSGVPSALTCSDVLPNASASVWAKTFAMSMS